MRRIPFVTLDVFASRPLEGNPLAVIPEAGALTEQEMPAIAREFNLSETTFVFRRANSIERSHGIRTRIFSTRQEMPFAGHPTLGTAAVMRSLGAGDDVALQLTVGRVPVRFSLRDDRPFGEMTQVDPIFGEAHERAKVAAALGVDVDAIEPSPPIQTVSTGVPFVIVPFARLSTLQQWSPDWHRIETYLQRTDGKFIYAVCRETASKDAQLHARMAFWAGEDPATGSAAGPAVAWMVRHRLAGPDATVAIEQGLEVGRPSRLFARAHLTDDRVTDVRVGGFYTPVSQGELTLP